MDSLRHTSPLSTKDVLTVLPGLFWDNDCVMLPELGGFVCNSKPARYDEEKLEIVPPSRDVLFNARLTTHDGVLANALMRKHCMVYRDALQAVERLVASLKAQLEASGSVTLPGLGTLYQENDGMLRFMADAEFERMLGSFGHASIPLSPLDARVALPDPAPMAPLSKETPKAAEPTKVRRISSHDEVLPWQVKLGRAAAAVAVPLTLAGAYLLSQPSGTETMLASNPLWNHAPIAASYTPAPSNAGLSFETPAAPKESPKAFVERTQWEGPLVFDLERGTPSTHGIRMTVPAEEVAPETAPEAAPEVAPPPPPAPIKFMIVGGAFSVKDNARKLAADLKTQGFETSLHVQANNGLTVVSMGGYATEADARVALQTARSQGHEKAWMKRL